MREVRQAGCGEGPHGVLTQPEVLRSDQASSPDTEGPPLLRHCPCRLASGLTSAGPGGGILGCGGAGRGPAVSARCRSRLQTRPKVSAEVAQAGTLACRAVPRHGCHTSARGWHCPAGRASGVERQADQETASALEHAAMLEASRGCAQLPGPRGSGKLPPSRQLGCRHPRSAGQGRALESGTQTRLAAPMLGRDAGSWRPPRGEALPGLRPPVRVGGEEAPRWTGRGQHLPPTSLFVATFLDHPGPHPDHAWRVASPGTNLHGPPAGQHFRTCRNLLPIRGPQRAFRPAVPPAPPGDHRDPPQSGTRWEKSHSLLWLGGKISSEETLKPPTIE